MSSLVENVPGFTSLEVSPERRAKQAAVRVVTRTGVAPGRVPKTDATDWLRGNRYNRTLPVAGRVLLFRHCPGEAPEPRSWVSKREDSRAGFARLSLLFFAFLQCFERLARKHLLIALLFERVVQ